MSRKLTFIPKLDQGNLPICELRIRLAGKLISRGIIQNHLETLGDIYSRKWSYDRTRWNVDDPFVWISGTCRAPLQLTHGLGYGTEPIEIKTQGMLWTGLGDGENVGFRASVQTKSNLRFTSNDIQEVGTYDLVKSYPCDHVPIPADW